MKTDLFPVVVLAGGLATRLRSLTHARPKSMIDVDGIPFIAHQLRLLHYQGVSKVTICAGHLGKQIESFVGDGRAFDLAVNYSYDGPRLLGTAGAIKHALPALDEPFFVLYGDSYLPCDFDAVQQAYLRLGRPALMTVHRNEGRWDTSNVEFANGFIVAYDKRNPTPRMCHIDYGLGMFNKSAFDRVSESSPYDLETLYQELRRAQDLAGFEVLERFYEIGSPVGLEETRVYLRNRAASLVQGLK